MKTKTNREQTATQTQNPQTVIYEAQEVEKISLSSILRKKYFEWCEESSAKKILLHILEIILIVALALLFYFPEYGGRIALAFFFLVWKLALAIAIVGGSFHWRGVRSSFRRVKKFFAKKFFAGNQHTIEGVPRSELIHLLFETNGFRLEDAKNTLGMSRKRFDPLAKKLERLGILERGENNARVLSATYSREQIADMIENSKKAEEIRYSDPLTEKGNFFKKFSIKKLIKEENDFVSSPPFTIRKIV